MEKIRKIFLLGVLLGVLTGFTAEQIALFQKQDASCWCDTDQEQKESSATKKLGEDEKVGPEFFQYRLFAGMESKGYYRTSFFEDNWYLSSTHCAVLTPPPECS